MRDEAVRAPKAARGIGLVADVPAALSQRHSAVCALASANRAASHLLEKAIVCFETERLVARGYLNDALILLRTEPTDSDADAAITRRTWRARGLPTWQVKRVLKYIDANLASKLSAAVIAATVALSPSHFSRSFSRALGYSPMAYVTIRRLEHAKTVMTATNEGLANIALACGFSDQAHFSKSFRRWMGLTPSDWRRRTQDS
jgi:AraC-like DNA-binding protein